MDVFRAAGLDRAAAVELGGGLSSEAWRVGDLHEGNVLVRGSEVGVIDFALMRLREVPDDREHAAAFLRPLQT